MEEAITSFPKQCAYVPEIKNRDALKTYKHYVVGGMGGSHLAAGIMKMWKPGIELYIHRDYELPPYEDSFFEESLLIASSYSGNTEEVIDFANFAIERGLSLAIMTTGGELLRLAEEHHLPHIVLPNDGIQPRSALGYSLIALATLMQEPDCVSDMHELGEILDPYTYKKAGEELAVQVGRSMPVIYTSMQNRSIAYNWKIKCNETAKVAACYNTFPELNHNEMQGFDEHVQPAHFIILRDNTDHPRVQKRMMVTAALLEKRGYGVHTLLLPGTTVLEKVFGSLLMADWMALAIARAHNQEPEAVPMIEEFKQKLQEPFDDMLTNQKPWK